MALHVMDEANHCLGCKVPRCQQGWQLFSQPHAVGGHGDLADAGGGFQPGHQLLHPRAHQRFAANG